MFYFLTLPDSSLFMCPCVAKMESLPPKQQALILQMPTAVYENPIESPGKFGKNIDRTTKLCRERWAVNVKTLYLIQPPILTGQQVRTLEICFPMACTAIFAHTIFTDCHRLAGKDCTSLPCFGRRGSHCRSNCHRCYIVRS